MKKIFVILIAVLLTVTVLLPQQAGAQAPEKMSYQAVIRDASDNLVTSTSVGMQISILQGSNTGTSVYVEIQTPTSNANGLVTIEIGEGTTTDDFSTIDWVNSIYFIKTETDPTGGTNYTITGTSQLLSVPYALHAKTAESVDNINITGNETAFDGWDKNQVDDFDGQYSSLTGAPANVSDFTNDAGYVTEFSEVDGSITNEIQDLQLTGNILTITNNSTATEIDLNTYLDNTDTQLTETEVDSYVANNGYLTTEVDGSVTNEIQSISRTGLTVTLSNGGGTFHDSVNVYTAGTGINITNNVISATGGSSSHYVGELYGGGIVYYVDQTGEHGLIASLDDLDGGSGIAWSDITATEIGASAKNYYDGTGNTSAIIGQAGHTSSAAKLCDDHSNDGFADWYLPSTIELRQMDDAILIINNVLANDGNGTTNPLNPENVTPTYSRYWSSTEEDGSNAWNYAFNYGYSNRVNKVNICRVRAVRVF